jgi:hypothetical protein
VNGRNTLLRRAARIGARTRVGFRAMKHALAFSFVLALAACGSKQPTPTGPTGGGSASGSAEGSGSASGSAAEETGSAFDKLDHAGKIKLMKEHVVPEIGAEMTAFDPKRWPKVECKTCHGKSAEDGTFKMPNPDLPKLDPSWFGPNPPADKKPILEFMEQKMKPDMAKILGDKEFDPAHPEAGGFGCLECHTMNK